MAHELIVGEPGDRARPPVASLRLPGALRAPTKGWPRPSRKSMPFTGLMLFTFVLFIAPQNIVPALEPLKLAKVAAALAGIAYLLNRTLTGRSLTVMASPVRWALTLAGLAILSIPAGFWPGGSVSVLLDLFGKSLVVFVLIANVVDTLNRAKILIGSMIVWGAYVAASAVANYMGGRLDPTGERVAGYESTMFINPNDLALTLNILLGLAIGLMPVLRRGWQRTLVGVAIVLFVAGVVVSFSRGGFITLGVLGAMWAARTLRERGGRALPSIALVVVVVAAAVPAGYSDRLSTIVHTEEDKTGSASERWETMMTAAQMIVERPVFGYGLGNSMHVAVQRGERAREAHNAYLKVGAELGVAALVVYVLFIWSSLAAARAIRRFFQRRREGWELGRLASGVELALVAFAVGAMFAPVPYHFYLYYPAGLAVALFVIASRVPPQPVRRRTA
jgi:O-antigen ligase